MSEMIAPMSRVVGVLTMIVALIVGSLGGLAVSPVAAAAAVTIEPGTLPNPTAGAAYSQLLSASGGDAPYTFAITAGTLPTGVTLAADGHLRGTPTATGTFNFAVTATDSTTGGTQTGTYPYSLTVAAPTISLGPVALPDGTIGSTFATTITAAGGTAPYRFAVTAGALPPGLTLASAGTLSGTPTTGGTFNFTVTATDSTTGGTYTASRAYTLKTAPPTISLAPVTLPDGTVGTSLVRTITAAGGTGPYQFAVTAGALPPGLTLASTGTLSGTPTAGGTFSFTLTATDSTTGPWGPFGGSRGYVLTVVAPTLTLGPATLPDAMAGAAYERTLTTSGGTAPHTFTVTAGSLPPGLTLTPDGRLSGTPSSPGSFTFTVTVADSSTGSGPYRVDREYTVGVAPAFTAPFLLAEPADVKALAGSDVVLRAAAAGHPSPGVQWQVDEGEGWQPLPGATSADLTLEDLTVDLDGHRYRAVFSSIAGTIATRTALLSVGVAPQVSRQPTDVLVPAGRDGELVAAASGSPAPSVQWQVDRAGTWSDIAGATSETLVLSDVTTDQDGTRFRAVFTNGYGEPAVSDPATLTVAVVPVVTRNPVHRSARAGGRATFRAAASGVPAPTVQWQVRVRGQWRDIADATHRRLVLEEVRRGWDGRRYRAVFTNAAGSSTSKAALIDVRRRGAR